MSCLLLPFAGSSFHGHPTELTVYTQTTAVGTCFDPGLGCGIAANLRKASNISYRVLGRVQAHREEKDDAPTFLRRHSSQARDTFERFLRALWSP